MTTNKLRVESVRVEGFRGFTSPQTVDFGGKSAFIFGSNGNGKSSIAEAILWCLFGGGEAPANVYYNQDCRVDLTLSRGSDRYRISRAQAHGSRESKAEVFVPGGATRNITDFAPNLKRLGESGTKFIFSGQGPKDRAEIKLEDFDRVLDAYLGLSELGSVAESLLDCHKDHDAGCDTLEGRINRLQQDAVSQRKAAFQRAKDLGLGDPIPSEADLRTRGLDLLQRVQAHGGLPIATPGPDVGTQTIICRIDELLRSPQLKAQLTSRIKELEEQLGRVQELNSRLAGLNGELASVTAQLSTLQSALIKERGDVSDADLDGRLRTIDGELADLASNHAVIEAASKHCDLHGWGSCPFCRGPISDAARARIAGENAALSPKNQEILIRRQETGARISKRTQLTGQISAAQARRDSLLTDTGRVEQERNELVATLRTKMGFTEGDLPTLTAQLERSIGEVRAHERAMDDVIQQRIAEVASLQSGTNYHTIMGKARTWDSFLSSAELADARQRLTEYRHFVTVAQEIMSAVQTERKRALETAVPMLNQHVTETYRLMTRQLSFPNARIWVRPGNGGDTRWGLDLQVGRADRQLWFPPRAVLNNQAWNALHILPFLAFAKLGLLDHELDLFIVDDPSQSFDVEHVRTLVEMLSGVATSTQLIIATHDEARFGPVAKELFGSARCAFVRVTGFDPDNGPRLEPVSVDEKL